MSKVPDVVRVRRLYRAIVNFEKELAQRDAACESTRQTTMRKYAIGDLLEAAARLVCALSDLEAAGEASE